MAFVNARTAIGTLLTTNWVVSPGGAARTPIAWPNVDFTPPRGSPWIRVAIIEGESFQLTLGGPTNVHRHPGVVYVSVFVPQNTGDAAVRLLADQVAAIFRSVAVDGTDGGTDEVLRFRTPRLRPMGSADGVYYQMNCEVPYVRDAIF